MPFKLSLFLPLLAKEGKGVVLISDNIVNNLVSEKNLVKKKE